jgi:DUF971 family protein
MTRTFIANSTAPAFRAIAALTAGCGRPKDHRHMPNAAAKANTMPETMPENAMTPRPEEIRVSPDRRLLTIGFDNGERFELPAEMLRVLSPSAEVQGHSPAERKLVPGKREVAISRLVPTGNYAVRIVFDDGHDTGIFTWAFFHDLGRHLGERIAAYDAEISEKGLSRDPPSRSR